MLINSGGSCHCSREGTLSSCVFPFLSLFVLWKREGQGVQFCPYLCFCLGTNIGCVCVFFCHCSRARQVYVNRYGIISKMCCWLGGKEAKWIVYLLCYHFARGARYTCHWRYLHKISLRGCIINQERELGECFSCRTNYPPALWLKT